MPKILITGNGFDLSFGLPTRYIDFVKITEFLVTEFNYNNYNKIFRDITNLNLSENQIEEIEFSKSDINQLKDLCKENYWFNYFKDEVNIETWIDFEKSFEFVLNNIFESYEIFQEEIFKSPLKERHVINFRKGLIDKHIIKQNLLIKFNFIKISKDIYDTIELNTRFIKRKYGYFIDVNKKEVADFLSAQLKAFKKIFALYLKIVVFPLYKYIYKSQMAASLNKIDKHFTFNYTPTFSRLIDSNKKTEFIHGKVDNSTSEIVLGVDNYQINPKLNNLLIEFSKYYQKIDLETDFKFLINTKIDEKHTIFFWGHSLNTSDKEYIDEVFSLTKDPNSHHLKIVIVYHNKEARSQLIKNLFLIRDKQEILELHKKELLVFYEINSKELKSELDKDLRYLMGADVIFGEIN